MTSKAILPLFPRLTLTECQQKGNRARMYLSVLLPYLKEASAIETTAEMLATRIVREDALGPALSDYEYAMLCAEACSQFVSNAQLEEEEKAHGFNLDLLGEEDPFEITDEGKAQFMRPLAFVSIFGVGWGARKTIEEQQAARFLHSANPVSGDAFEYWGPELRQEDLSVLLWFAKKNEGRRPGARVSFDAKELLQDIGRSYHSNNLKWLFGSAIPSLERAHLALFNTKTMRRRSYRLVTRTELPFELDSNGNPSYSLKNTEGWFELDKDYRSLLTLHENLKQTYLIDTDVRKALSSKPMALWLHMLTSSNFHAQGPSSCGHFTRDVATLKLWCYGDLASAPSDKEFSRRLRDAAAELQEAGALHAFKIWHGKASFTAKPPTGGA